MIQLHYLTFAEEQLKTLDFDNKNDVIRLEKILKAESKLNSDFKINDIENLLGFLHLHGSKFLPLLKHKNIATILKGEGHYINFAPFKEEVNEEVLDEFVQLFEDNILNYLKNCIPQSRWSSIKSVFKTYPFLLSDYIVQEVFDTLSLKNQAIADALASGNYADFVGRNPYASDSGYYSLLSEMDEYYFEEDIRQINNITVAKQKEKKANIAALGKILYAATFYNAYTDELASVLKDNQDVAYSWIDPQHEKSVAWTTTNIIILIVVILGAILFAVALPGSFGGGAWVAVIVGNIAYQLLKKK